jgi:hypothetical protein
MDMAKCKILIGSPLSTIGYYLSSIFSKTPKRPKNLTPLEDLSVTQQQLVLRKMLGKVARQGGATKCNNV